MSNAKLRHWIYLAIGFLILIAAGWFLLMRPARHTDETMPEIFSEHRAAFQAVAVYLCSKDIPTNITAVPTIDERFGIPVEDTDPYHAYNDGIIELLHTEIDSVRYADGTVTFMTPESGGFAVRCRSAFAYGNVPPEESGAPRNPLPESNWYYFISMKEE